jgi:hypothetical protein
MAISRASERVPAPTRVQAIWPFVPAAGLMLLWGGVSAGLALWFSGRISDWSVMTDELQYVKLATAIADSYSPLPTIHGSSVSVLNQLYPLLIAPLFGARPTPAAFRASHVLNAVVMASAALPAYLLARQVLIRTWSLAVAGLSVVVPWMVLTGFLMTEVAAYPTFLWVVLGLQLAIVAPSPRHDLLAAAALGVAVFARTQFAVLALVLPLAILGFELGQSFSCPGSGSGGRKLRVGTWKTLHGHVLLAVLYAVGIGAVAMVAVFGSVGGLLGTYAVTVEGGSVLPSGVWSAAAKHIDTVGVGCGLAPLILGGGWMLAGTVRPRSRPEAALATLSLVTVVLLTLEVASYNLRFGGTGLVRDRYLFYIVPLLLVGSAAALTTAPRRHVAAGAALVAIFFAATVPQLAFTTFPGISVDSPASVLNDFLGEQSGALGTGASVAVGGLLLGLVLTLGVLLAPRTPFALLVFAALLTFSILTLRTAVDRVVTGTALTGRPLAGPPGRVLDWVDSVLPNDARAAVIPFPLSTAWDTSAIGWWDVEFWNRSVAQTYVAADGNFTYTPFPSQELSIDWQTGEIAGTADAPPYVVAAAHDPRFQLAGPLHAENLGLVVIAAERPYRALWASRRLQTDGWTRPASPATIRVYDPGRDTSELVYVRITLQAPPAAPARYRVSTVEGEIRGLLTGGEARAEEVSVCVRAGSVADVTVLGSSGARIEGPPLSPEPQPRRAVGVGVTSVFVLPTRRTCDLASLIS